MLSARTLAIVVGALTLAACGEVDETTDGSGGGGGDLATSTADSVGGSSTSATGGGGESTTLPEEQPTPAEGAGLSDPQSNSLHDHGCAGVDWQRIHGWLLLKHAAPEVGPADEMQRCVERYAGWVTNDADAHEVSRASVYAALAATGQCDQDADYDGAALLPAALCMKVHPELDAAECVAQMGELRSFGIETLAAAIQASATTHKRDVPLMATYLSQGSIACGGSDRWKLVAPEGYVDRYVAAYNAYKASTAAVPVCSKHIVVSVALYTGMDDPGENGVAAANGCWTYERISKSNAEWKICNYDGTVNHPDGVKWVYDDTNTGHVAATDKSRIQACKSGVPGRGYVYMTNRGAGWPRVLENDVQVHFAEIYSGQYAVADQLSAWKTNDPPSQPMVNFGEATTSAATIKSTTNSVCPLVGNNGYFGVYVYPESLRTGRMSAMVQALNACTE